MSPSKEEWDKIEAETRKAQDEAFAKHKAEQGEIVASSGFIVSDPDEICPARPISKQEIAHVVMMHKVIFTSLECAFDIGHKLRNWHGLVPSGKWLKWLEQNIPEISERMASTYIRLWDNHEWLRKHPQISDGVANSEIPPSIRKAEALIREKDGNKPRGAPKRKVGFVRPKEPATIDVKTEVVSPTDARTHKPLPPGNAGATTVVPESEPEPGPEFEPEPAFNADEMEEEFYQVPDDPKKEIDAARYCVNDLTTNAPHIWEKLCEGCQAILKEGVWNQ
jgi:hypothetical protein